MKYLRRLIWYISSRLFILCCVLGLATMAFYFAMNSTNIYIIVKDGLAKRAQVVMMGADENLNNYFSAACQERDTQLAEARNGRSPYQLYYNITGFDHRIALDSFWCWPWDDTARAVVTERIPAIDGKIRTASKEEAANAGYTQTTPQWPSRQYTVLLGRENGQWHVKNLTMTQLLPDQ